jgi:hypothetical protein
MGGPVKPWGDACTRCAGAVIPGTGHAPEDCIAHLKWKLGQAHDELARERDVHEETKGRLSVNHAYIGQLSAEIVAAQAAARRPDRAAWGRRAGEHDREQRLNGYR